jgi:hypothetical protein
MKNENPFLEKMETLDDVALLKVLKSKADYQPEAIDAAVVVATQRKLIDENFEIISEDLKSNDEIKKTTIAAKVKAEKEKTEKENAPLKRKKRLIIRITIAAIIFIFSLTFHFIPSRMMLFPKNSITFSHTIITESDISDAVDRYNNASLMQKQAMSKDPFIQKLFEKGILYEERQKF